jgi:hypothetical protein
MFVNQCTLSGASSHQSTCYHTIHPPTWRPLSFLVPPSLPVVSLAAGSFTQSNPRTGPMSLCPPPQGPCSLTRAPSSVPLLTRAPAVRHISRPYWPASLFLDAYFRPILSSIQTRALVPRAFFLHILTLKNVTDM